MGVYGASRYFVVSNSYKAVYDIIGPFNRAREGGCRFCPPLMLFEDIKKNLRIDSYELFST